MVTSLFYVMWMLCGLGAAVFTASAKRTWYNAAALIAGFVATAILFDKRGADLQWTGFLAACVAVMLVVRPRWAWMGAIAGGSLAGIIAALLASQGLPKWAALVIAILILLISAIVSNRPNFASRAIREEALLGVAGLGVVAALAPAVMAGWQSALGLNLEQKTSAAPQFPIWVLLLSMLAAVCGAIYSAISTTRFDRR